MDQRDGTAGRPPISHTQRHGSGIARLRPLIISKALELLLARTQQPRADAKSLSRPCRRAQIGVGEMFPFRLRRSGEPAQPGISLPAGLYLMTLCIQRGKPLTEIVILQLLDHRLLDTARIWQLTTSGPAQGKPHCCLTCSYNEVIAAGEWRSLSYRRIVPAPPDLVKHEVSAPGSFAKQQAIGIVSVLPAEALQPGDSRSVLRASGFSNRRPLRQCARRGVGCVMHSQGRPGWMGLTPR